MKNQFSNKPAYIQKELQNMQNQSSALIKKNSIFRSLAFMLIIFSLMNLAYSLFVDQSGFLSKFALGVFALSGAVGFALSKESKILNREIFTRSRDYIVNRMKNGEYLSEQRKASYCSKIMEQPFMVLPGFIEYLAEEERAKNREINK